MPDRVSPASQIGRVPKRVDDAQLRAVPVHSTALWPRPDRIASNRVAAASISANFAVPVDPAHNAGIMAKIELPDAFEALATLVPSQNGKDRIRQW